MAHNIETMAYVGEVPWHGLGTKLEFKNEDGSPRLATGNEMLAAAGLDNWGLIKRPLYVVQDVKDGIPTSYRALDTAFEVFRPKDSKHISTVGANYTILQNEDVIPFFTAVAGEGAAVFETAGSLQGGKIVWFLAKLPGEIRVLGDDVTNKYLMFGNGHDGQHQIMINFVNIRIVCNNTYNAAVGGLSSMFKIRHTPNVAMHVDKAGKVLAQHMNWSQQYQRYAEVLTSKQVSDTERKDYYRKVFNRMPVTADSYDVSMGKEALNAALEQAVEVKWKMEAKLESRHHADPAIAQFKGYENTPWHLLNDVTHVLDFMSNRRTSTDSMSGVLFNNDVINTKSRAMDYALELV
jgi:phage/plasmid-like protein (TIGR03299 family)